MFKSNLKHEIACAGRVTVQSQTGAQAGYLTNPSSHWALLRLMRQQSKLITSWLVGLSVPPKKEHFPLIINNNIQTGQLLMEAEQLL